MSFFTYKLIETEDSNNVEQHNYNVIVKGPSGWTIFGYIILAILVLAIMVCGFLMGLGSDD